jgi:hypothetical protein
MGLFRFHWHLVLSSHLVFSWMKFLIHSVMEVWCIEGSGQVKNSDFDIELYSCLSRN